MNSNEINFYMMKDPLIKERYIGVIHQKENQDIEIFDSLGHKPQKEIHNLLISNNKSYMYNNKRVQDYFTESCGYFCLFYSYYSCRGLHLQEILNIFNSNLKSNEIIVQRFLLTNSCRTAATYYPLLFSINI